MKRLDRMRRPSTVRTLLWALAGAALVVTACVPGAGPSTGGGAVERPPSGPKTITLGLVEEPTPLLLYGRPERAGGTLTAVFERYFVFHASLTLHDRQRNIIPHIAQKVPSIENGDWKVNPDSSMEVTWRLRPDVYWHDGTPLSAEDFVFGFEVTMDPRLAVATLGDLVNISAVRAADPHTLVVSWKTLSITADTNSAEGIPAVSRHQAEELYRTADAATFQAAPAWRDQFVGLGPYRLGRWELGSSVEADAFDGYFLGRPKIDKLIFRWVPDENVLTAQVLAGAIDLIPAGTSIKPEQMVEIRRQWGADGLTVAASFDIRVMLLNLKPDGQPWAAGQAGWQQDARFRQAMLHSLNRQQLVDVLQSGWTEVAEWFAFPEEPVYGLASQRGLVKYPYDPTRAQRLFSETGWTKGADGMLRNSAGQTVHFICCRRTTAGSNDVRESFGWGEDLKAAGFEMENPIPLLPAGLSTVEQRKTGLVGWSGQISNFRIATNENWATFVQEYIAREDNRYIGSNSGAYVNPTYETLYAQRMKTLNVTARNEIEFQLLKIVMEDLPALPVYYNPIGVVARKGLVGVGKGVPLNRGITADVHLWDLVS